MNSIQELVTAAGGALHRRDLLRHGIRPRELTCAVRDGIVRRPRRGWYSTFEPDDPRFVAMSVGGRLTGAAAVKLLGGWMWAADPPPVVSVARNAARLHRRRGVRVVHDRPSVVARGPAWAVDPRDALARAVVEAEFEEAVALWDWARRSPHFTPAELHEVARALPADARGIVTWSDAESQSFLESVGRVRFVADGHDVQTQVGVEGGRSIDLVVDGVLGVEIDGYAFHADSFEADRSKDLAITCEGRVPMRLSSALIRRAWHRVTVAAREAIARHIPSLPPPRRQASRAPSPRLAPRRRRWRCRRLGIDDLRSDHFAPPERRLTSSEREAVGILDRRPASDLARAESHS